MSFVLEKLSLLHVDTAAVYKNESDIGDCLIELLPKYGLTRNDIFLTSKLAPKDQGANRCREACLTSLTNLKTEYLDLYLIHWPGTQGRKPGDQDNPRLRRDSWRDMETLYKEGKLKAIGVSNFEQRHLIDLLESCEIQPHVLQTEHHPHLVQSSLVEFCRHHQIHFQAYASLGTTTDNNKLLTDPTVISIAKNNSKTTAQILLKWAIQQDIGVIPKSSNPDHIKSNMDLFSFELSKEDLARISGLDSQHHYCWDPRGIL
ncbi:uncharacterized oxidoreductase YtbE-like isoform X2 [Dreissena polymorpha]|uniref:uncharacterized oxidoreductase YtbE-like isoform X2 n=1 Tax=Dreissena polymorpha TaxID=45954 RepID=UPI0022656CDF|nr:uncharacterized oxidoreductase YtbE-like isoform X2 [Dreissena polymorpha]